MADSSESKIGREFLNAISQSTTGYPTTEQQRAIDKVCAIFEESWELNSNLIETLLEQHSELCQTTLFENLIAIEFELSWSANQPPDLDRYLNRFKSQMPRVTRVFDQVKQEMLESTQQTMVANSFETAQLDSGKPTSWPRITGYEVLAEIGRGGMGVVYRARQLALNREVALKVIARGRQADASRRERFKREGEIVANFTHPNIVHVYDAGECNGQSYFASELIEGGTLADLKTPIAPNEALQFMVTVADAVAIAHASGVVHCDLKPANILMAKSVDGISTGNQAFVPKIADFGLASSLNLPAAAASDFCGTPDYMAPEQAKTDAAITKATDVHALGLILYKLLTGVNPFLAETVDETLDKVRHHHPTPAEQLNPAVSQELSNICLTCLEKEPSERYESAGELAAALRKAMLVGAKSMGRRKWMVLSSLAGVSIVTAGLRRAFNSNGSPEPASTKIATRNVPLIEAIIESPDSWLTALIDGKELYVEKSHLDKLEKSKIIRVRLPRQIKLLPHQRKELSSWASLSTLEAAHTPFNDDDAEVIPKLTSLESLDLFGSSVSGRCVEMMIGLRKLTYLSVGQTAITILDLSRLSDLPIDTLNLAGSNFDEHDAAENLMRLKSLASLQVVDCSIDQLEAAVDVNGLTELRVYPGLFSDRAIKAIGRLSKLESLDMTVEQPINDPIDISKIKSLRKLKLRFNQPHEQMPELNLPKSLRLLTILGDVKMDYEYWSHRYPAIEIHHGGRLTGEALQ